jgi:segregation and condensation protein B
MKTWFPSCCAWSTGRWPFPPNYQLMPQPLAALDLLEYPDQVAQRIGREVLHSLADASPVVLARRSARARVLTGPRVGKLLRAAGVRGQTPAAVEGDPRGDTRAAAGHVLGVLWASASRGATVKELRAAIGLTRERLEAAYAYLLDYPLLGLTVMREGDEFQLVTSGQVAASVERHLNAPRPVGLSGAALQVLTIVAYRQPVSQAGIESVRGTSSDSAIGTLLQRQLIALDEHRLFTTTPAFLKYLGLRDLADLPPLPELETEGGIQGWRPLASRMTGYEQANART